MNAPCPARATSDVDDYVGCTNSRFRWNLSPGQLAAYKAAANLVDMARTQPLDVRLVYDIMMGVEGSVYRSSVAVNQYCDVRSTVVKSNSLPYMMSRFEQSYEAVFATQDMDARRLHDMAEYIGVLGRVIHPFVTGNTRLFLLMENHIRQKHGVSWRTNWPERDEFEKTRSMIMQTYPECF